MTVTKADAGTHLRNALNGWRERRACRKHGHAWAHFLSTSHYRITEICVRGSCEASLTRDMTDTERDDFDREREALEGWKDDDLD